MFQKILIANRGEIACRIIRTARRMGVLTVAVYSDSDKNALFVREADESVALGGMVAQESYLKIEKIIDAAKKTGAQAIHPGYGFLSENAAFADACKKANIVFIGPPADAIKAMGSKSAAKSLMEKAKVPVVPGYHGESQDVDTLKKAAAKIGYPVLLKAVSGGGGKGMRRVDREADLESALLSAQREGQSSFGDARVLLEKYIEDPRHIEIQVFSDTHGNHFYLSERDCSIQRRHQKIIEEAPAPGISDAQRRDMGLAAVKAANAVDYVGAGTVEFIADPKGNFYFMEMNTRLQVEHPVTEMVLGLDLVEWQLRVASGDKLPFVQKDLQPKGHAVELRLYAEDPAGGFLPAIGKLHHLAFPERPGLRIDSGVVTGDEITPYFDPMIAKIIAHGENRGAAIEKLLSALKSCEVLGLKTNLAFLHDVLAHPAFMQAKLSTHFIEQHRADLFRDQTPPQKAKPFVLAVVAMTLAQRAKKSSPAWQNNPGFRLGDFGKSFFYFDRDGEILPVLIRFSRDGWTVECFGANAVIHDARLCGERLYGQYDGKPIEAVVIRRDDTVYVSCEGVAGILHIAKSLGKNDGAGGSLRAPMPGKVIQVMVKPQQKVESGQALIVLEAMKMEHTIKAPKSGLVKEVFFKAGEQVQEGVELLAIE